MVSITRTALAALLVMGALSLTGCEGILYTTYHDQERDGGVTPEEAEQLVLSIEGITEADYSTDLWDSPGEGGLFASEGMNVILAVTVDPEWSIADPEAFLGFLAATAWSVNEHYPDGQVIIAVTGGVDRVFDWAGTAAAVFDDESITYVRFTGYSGVAEAVGEGTPIALSTAKYGERFGRWPSDPVEVPSGMLVNEPPAVTVVPAIEKLVFVELADPQPNGDECYHVSFRRALGGAGEYEGTVSVTLLADDGAEIDTAQIVAPDIFTQFCFAEGELPEDAALTFRSETVDGFSDVDETLTAD
jgi:hypothetical protein